MLEVVDNVRAIEDQYYAGLSVEHQVAIQQRNDGIRLVRSAGERAVGLAMLRSSVEAFGGVDLVANPSTGALVERERYASAYMLARGLLISGDYTAARTVAMAAVDLTPQVPVDLRPQRKFDQYVPIASGILALVLATLEHGFGEDEDWDVRAAAAKVVEQAKLSARVSEDPKKVLFPARKKSNVWRLAARTRHRFIARAAQVTQQVPAAHVRKAIARRLV